MHLACCLWALPGSERDQIDRVDSLGFSWIDIQPPMLRTPTLRDAADALGLQRSCIGVSFGMPEGAGLESGDEDARTVARRHVEEAIDHGASLGATVAYTVPGFDPNLTHYAHEIEGLAQHAANRGLSLCIEHFPGRALPTVEATLRFIETIDHPNLKLLLDLGHCQISGEDAVEAIERSGQRLGYVHLDDNDGQRDLHWGLLDGVMSEADLTRTLDALSALGYTGAVSLELSPNLPDPATALAHSRSLVLGLFSELS